MSFKSKIFFTFFAISSNMFSASISGTGYGLTIDEAKKEALSDVLVNVGGMVSSSFSQTQILNNGNVEANLKNKVLKVEQNYPLLLPIFSEPQFDGTKYIVNVKIDGNNSAQQYINQLKKIETNIRTYISDAEKNDNKNLKIELLEKSLNSFDEFEKYSSMARILDIKNIPVLTISPIVIENQIAKLSFQNDDNKNLFKLNKDDFNVEVKTDPANSSFKLGERYEIFVKLSEAGYFYVINHSITDSNESYSYLVEFNENAKDINKFIVELPKDMVGQWFSIGEYEVVEPVGNEYIEVVASQKPFISVPKFERVEKFGTDFYMLKGNRASKNIIELSKTRAVKKVNEKYAKTSYHTSK